MQVYFEMEVMGKDVTIAAKANDVNEYSEALNLRMFIVLPNENLIPLHKYTDDIDEVERITEACLSELYSNKYEGGITLE